MKYLKVYVDFATAMEALSDAEKGRLFVAMLQYAADPGAAPDLRGGERILWATAKQAIDRERESYDKLCDRNQRNASSRYHTQPAATSGNVSQQDKDKDKETIKEKPSKDGKEQVKRFIRPTVDDVTSYCRASGITVDAEAFVDFYDSKGWKVGNTPMKDWMAAVRNWARKDADRKPAAKKRMGSHAGYAQTPFPEGAIEFVDLDHDLQFG